MALLLLGSLALASGSPVQQYGHCAQWPGDFSAEQYAEVAERFPLFTVEKRHAYGVYGNASAPTTSSEHYKNIEATVGTARKIKALHAGAKVLMYWSSYTHYTFYECEDSVQPSWLQPKEEGHSFQKWNYSSAAFRTWWTKCAADAVLNSNSALDGVFVDEVGGPQSRPDELPLLKEMMDNLKHALGSERIMLYNDHNVTLLPHADGNFNEMFARHIVAPGETTPFLRALEKGFKENPGKLFIARYDDTDPDNSFEYVYGCFLLVRPAENSFFLKNNGSTYNIDAGVLDPAPSEYFLQLGDPIADFDDDGSILTRKFQHGVVTVDIVKKTATFELTKPALLV